MPSGNWPQNPAGSTKSRWKSIESSAVCAGSKAKPRPALQGTDKGMAGLRLTLAVRPSLSQPVPGK
jgi:hypothetical protein